MRLLFWRKKRKKVLIQAKKADYICFSAEEVVRAEVIVEKAIRKAGSVVGAARRLGLEVPKGMVGRGYGVGSLGSGIIDLGLVHESVLHRDMPFQLLKAECIKAGGKCKPNCSDCLCLISARPKSAELSA